MKLSETFDKRYLSRTALTVLTTLLAVGAVVYAASHVARQFSSELNLVDAVPTTVTRTISADAYIMRTEYPLHASRTTAGSVAPAIHDGGRISVDMKIADIYSAAAPDVEIRLAELDEQIDLLEKNRAENRSVQSTAGLDAAIYDRVFAVRSDAAAGHYADALSLRTPLLVDIRKRAILTGEIKDYGAQITRLEQEKNTLKTSLGPCLETVYAGSTGYYFSEYDGYGSVFSADKIDTMTYDDFIAMTQASPEQETGLCIGTSVQDFYWYIACPMTKTEAGVFDDRSACRVLFDYSGTALEMDVYRTLVQTPGDRAVVVFRCGKMPQGFDYTRMQPVRISAVEYTGYQIPLSAVRVVGGYEGVYILDEVTLAFRRIQILYQDGKNVVCTGRPEGLEPSPEDEIFPWLRQNDIIVVGGTDLYSGKVMG